MKTIKKTVEVIDKFSITGYVKGYNAESGLYGGVDYTVDYIDERGSNFSLPANQEFLQKIQDKNYTIEMEIKFIERK